MAVSGVSVLFRLPLHPPCELDDSSGEESWLASSLPPPAPADRAELGFLPLEGGFWQLIVWLLN
jgi:hypothetical protein